MFVEVKENYLITQFNEFVRSIENAWRKLKTYFWHGIKRFRTGKFDRKIWRVYNVSVKMYNGKRKGHIYRRNYTNVN